ncbi:MAG: TniQ family protein [Acidobacteriota bacterium]
MSLTSRAKYHLYPSWDLTPPSPSPRSRLNHLTPIGIGTPETESCRSYIARLAATHCISIHSLFRDELVPASGNPHIMRADSTFMSSGHYRPLMKSISGLNPGAERWIEVLEKLTLQRRLRFLTMLTWRNELTTNSLLRSIRAWCSRCLQEQRDCGETVYEQILWTLKTVNGCVRHRSKLETICPHCGKQPPPFASEVFSGICPSCREWLGYSDQPKRSNIEDEALKYQLWIAGQMGDLIAAAPSQSSEPSRDRLTKIVPKLIKRAADGNATAFAEIVGIRRITIYLWLQREYVPTTDFMLKICYRLGVSFSDILTKQEIIADGDFKGNLQILNQSVAAAMLPHREDTLKNQLLTALEEIPPPTLREVANRLGYKGTSSLRARCPELVKLLTSRHRAAFPLHRKIRDSTVVKLALQQALKMNPPPPLDEIARDLGYAESRSLQQYRTLYDAIVIRRADYWSKCRNDLRLKLEATLVEDPPRTLKQVAKSFGFKAPTSIRNGYPELATAIVTRHAMYCTAQFENICDALQSSLCEEPAICLRTIASRLGRSCDYLRLQFPKESGAIVKRHSDFNHNAVRQRKALAKTKVRQLALDLGARGLYPSYTRIRRASNGPIGLDCLEVSTALRDIRRRLALLKNRRR